MSTYIEKFNFYLKTFLQELITIFPENKDSFTQNYSLVLETDNVNSDEYVKEYMLGVSPYHSDISQKNNKLFLGDNELKFLRDTDFRNLWTKDLSDSTRENIWKYLQTLYVLGKKIVPEDDDVNQMLNELNALNNDEQTKSNIENHQKEMMDMIENISKITEKEQEKGDKPGVQQLFNNGIISDIAKELTNELDLDKLDLGNPQNMNEAFSNIMGGAGGNNFFDLISKVGEKIQSKVESGQINQTDLISEAQKMMGGLQNPEQMAKSMMNKNGFGKSKGPETTRERLRRKLDKKEKEAEQ
tara:strand:- start:8 stop:907 length:900 start_codon:yes stop_codon:yes gene_type:complete